MDYSTSTTFGDRLRRYRLAAGLTQEELAERTGLGVRSIQHLEGGGHLPHCDTLGRLIEGLGLNGGERNELERLARPAPRAAETASGPPVQQFDHAPRHNLPTQLTSFVGRDREQAEATRLLGTTRLLTITGVGGTGKTRLALKVASDAIASYSEGVWFVDLAPVADPAVVPRTIASVLGVTEQSGESVLATVLRVMRDRQVLLILDNCEHLIDACARLTDALLRGCPRVQILATSREALGIAGEVTWSLPSLPVPTADWQAAHRGDSVVALSDVAAIRLFVDRARAAEPGFNVSDQNIAAVIQICRRVDGIPLAIELAAARVKVFSVERISGRLDNLFRLLTGGSRTALPRQQTLKATIDWSHDLLTEPERVLFRRLSVFVGGCSYEAIEGVCTGDGIDVVDVADLLTRLVERSLVVVEQLDRERYRLLETLRQYGRDRLLEAGEAEAVRDRHCDWFLELAERVAPELIGPHQVAWLDRLDNEQDNLRAALAWCLEGRPAIVGLRLAGAMWRWWHVRDREREGSEWLRRVLAAPGAQGATAARATALQGMTELPALAEGIASVEAQQAAEESVAICQEIGDLAGAAWSMNMIGRRAAFRGDGAQAESLLEQALALARQVGARWAEAQILEGFGYLAGFRDDVPKERRYFEEALALFRALDDRRAIAWASMGVGVAAGVLGDTATARARLSEALSISRELRSRARCAVMLLFSGALARIEGNATQSYLFLDEALAVARDIGAQWLYGLGLLYSGWLARAEGNTEQAVELTQAALRVLKGTIDRESLVQALRNLGILAIEADRSRRGARLLGASEGIGNIDLVWGRLGDDPQAYAAAKLAARTTLTELEFERAWAEGRAMTPEQAMAYALEEGGD